MPKRVKDGWPWLRWDGPLPKLVLHEKHEHNVKWGIRTFTGMGVAASLISLPPLAAFSLSAGLVALNAFLEKTLFYFTSLTSQHCLILSTNLTSGWQWSMSRSDRRLRNQTRSLASSFPTRNTPNFFNLLRAWNNGSSEDTDNNIQLSFITDEDLYYVYLYPSIEKTSIKKAFTKAKRQGLFKKYGKEHLGIVMQMIICHGFETAGAYALGEFTDNHPIGKHFLLGAFYSDGRGRPGPIEDIEPISKLHYKAKVRGDLTEEDFELVHWKRLVRR